MAYMLYQSSAILNLKMGLHLALLQKCFIFTLRCDKHVIEPIPNPVIFTDYQVGKVYEVIFICHSSYS